MNPCPPNVSSPFGCGPDSLAASGTGDPRVFIVIAAVIVVGVILLIVRHWWADR